MGASWAVRDAIHGDVTLPSWARTVVDHPRFQRLRHIRQNGLLYLIYPGATHTRFEHSIGAAHLASCWFERLVEPPPVSRMYAMPCGRELRFCETERLLKIVTKNEKSLKKWNGVFVAAALLHDVGHGPLSHTLEQLKLLPRAESLSDWSDSAHLGKKYVEKLVRSQGQVTHEYMSLYYSDEILRDLAGVDHEVDRLLKHIDFVHLLISSDLRGAYSTIPGMSADERAICELLGSFISGAFDVDRFDYLLRDSHGAGVVYGKVDVARMMAAIRPVIVDVGGQRRVHYQTKFKQVHAIDHYLMAMYEMYTQVYNHPKNIAFSFQLERLITRLKDLNTRVVNPPSLSWHRNAGDSDLRALLVDACKDLEGTRVSAATETIEAFFSRRFARGEGRERTTYVTGAAGSNPTAKLIHDGWRMLPAVERKMLKDSIDVWISYDLPPEHPFEYQHWSNKSLIASKLAGHSFRSQILWRNSAFDAALEAFGDPGNQAIGGNDSEAVGDS